MKDTSSATGRTESWSSVKARCHNDDCTIHSRGGSKAYEGDVEDHQLVLVVLYGHTQHGSCGLDVEVDGEAWPTR